MIRRTLLLDLAAVKEWAEYHNLTGIIKLIHNASENISEHSFGNHFTGQHKSKNQSVHLFKVHLERLVQGSNIAWLGTLQLIESFLIIVDPTMFNNIFNWFEIYRELLMTLCASTLANLLGFNVLLETCTVADFNVDDYAILVAQLVQKFSPIYLKSGGTNQQLEEDQTQMLDIFVEDNETEISEFTRAVTERSLSVRKIQALLSEHTLTRFDTLARQFVKKILSHLYPRPRLVCQYLHPPEDIAPEEVPLVARSDRHIPVRGTKLETIREVQQPHSVVVKPKHWQDDDEEDKENVPNSALKTSKPPTRKSGPTRNPQPTLGQPDPNSPLAVTNQPAVEQEQKQEHQEQDEPEEDQSDISSLSSTPAKKWNAVRSQRRAEAAQLKRSLSRTAGADGR